MWPAPTAHDLDADAERGADARTAVTATRIGWAIVAALCMGLLLASLPTRWGELARLAPARESASPNSAASLAFAISLFALELLGPLVFVTLALLIFWRRDDDLGAIRISALLIAFGAALPGAAYAIISDTLIWRVAPGALQAIGWTALLIFAYVFPDGRWTPHWSRWVTPAWALWVFGFFAFAERLIAGKPTLIVVAYLIWIAWLGTGVCAQVYRYFWVATLAQREQTRWIALGFAGALIGILLVSAQHILALAQGENVRHDALTTALALVTLTISTLPIPVSIAIAILRHKLYNIDRLINLGLVYGSLTLALGVVYVGMVGLSQFVMHSVTGQRGQSQLALTISTLAAATLFQPLRRRIQTTIDRYFYRRHYDATKIITAFSASLRTEVDLAEISQRLVQAAHHTMKPRHVSLWLAQPPTRAPADDTDAMPDDAP